MAIFAGTPPGPDSALRLPALKRILTPASQRLSNITEGPKADSCDLELPPTSLLRDSGASSHRLSIITEGSGADSCDLELPPRSLLRNSGASATPVPDTLLLPSIESARASRDTARSGPPSYEWVHEPSGADRASALLIDDEKLAHLRQNGNRRRRGGRGGWGRLALLVALVLLVLVGLGVGLGVGLSRRKGGNGKDVPVGSDSEPSVGSTSGATLLQQFPLGEYSMITSLRTVATNCSSNPATWRCYPYSIFNPSDPSTNTSSLATFNWIITNTSATYATNSTPATPSYGVDSNLTISSTNNPFSIAFANLSLTYLNPTPSNDSSARYTFTFQMSKSVIPETAITTNGASATCIYNQTSFIGTLYLAAPRTFPSKGSADMGGYTPWPYALQITQSSFGGENVPACYETLNGNVGARVTAGLTPQSTESECACDYRNY